MQRPGHATHILAARPKVQGRQRDRASPRRSCTKGAARCWTADMPGARTPAVPLPVSNQPHAAALPAGRLPSTGWPQAPAHTPTQLRATAASVKTVQAADSCKVCGRRCLQGRSRGSGALCTTRLGAQDLLVPATPPAAHAACRTRARHRPAAPRARPHPRRPHPPNAPRRPGCPSVQGAESAPQFLGQLRPGPAWPTSSTPCAMPQCCFTSISLLRSPT